MTTISTEQFHSDVEGAERAALTGPVFVLDGETPEYVVLTFKDFDKMRGKSANLADALGMPVEAVDAINCEFPKLEIKLRMPDFS